MQATPLGGEARQDGGMMRRRKTRKRKRKMKRKTKRKAEIMTI